MPKSPNLELVEKLIEARYKKKDKKKPKMKVSGGQVKKLVEIIKKK